MASAPVKLAVEYESADELLADFATLTPCRMVIATERELPIHAAVQLTLRFPGLVQPILLHGYVHSTRSDDPVAGAHIELDSNDWTRFATQVERIRARDPEVVSRLIRVLLVEDNKHIASLIQDGVRSAIRRELGSQVSFAFQRVEDGRSAVELLQREPFDAAIIDVYLPILEGPRVITHARGELGLSELAIIAISAGGEAARHAALGAGADTFLAKPMRVAQVIDVIKRLLRIGPHHAGEAVAT